MTADSAVLEISLRWRRQVEGFGVTLRYSNPQDDTDVAVSVDQPLQLDFSHLATLAADEIAYSRALSESLLGVEEVREAFAKARSVAKRRAVALRLLLVVDSKAPARFHALRWETLRDLDSGRPIATTSNILFSRHLGSTGWRPIPARSGDKPSALVVIANPSNLEQYAPGGRPLTAIDVADVLHRAQTALDRYQISALRSPGASLDGITAALDEGRHDVLYLVCHGAFLEGESVLYLEGPDENVAATTGADLVERLGELLQPPSLTVLGAPMTGEASSQDDGALAPMALRLAEIGIAAVVAMQGNVSLQTITDLMPVFFKELQLDGRVDRAMAVARRAVRDRPDWWCPVLYLRSRSGRIWHLASKSGLGEDGVTSPAISSEGMAPGSTAAGRASLDDPHHVLSSAQLRAFLCHSSSDKDAVRKLYRRLLADHIRPWLDEEDILPGQIWDREIRKAIRSCDVILVCLSRSSIGKVGYIQKEIRDVLDVADEQPDGTIFLIPIRLEPCEVPDRIARVQWVDLFEGETAYERLIRSLRRVTPRETN